MRPLLLSILFIFAHAIAAAELSTIRIWPQYRTADSFDRMGEFFTGQEKAGGETILRSSSEDRNGFYFLLRLRNSGDPIQNLRTELRVILPDSPKPRLVERFPGLSLRHGTQVVHFGLTGTDWPDEIRNPVAWELRLFDTSGQVVLREASFLWSAP